MLSKRAQQLSRGTPAWEHELNELISPNRWKQERRAGLAAPRRYPVVRLTEAGVDSSTRPRLGDEIGYCMDPWRYDDCLQAAVATATQVPIQNVPALELHKQFCQGADPDAISRDAWARFEQFASGRGMQMVFHDTVPAARRRWIAVAVRPKLFGDHCFVMSHDRLLFDPGISLRRPPGRELRRYRPTEIAYGISFDPKEK